MKCQRGEPVSYLRLELYGLGELPEPEAGEIAEHLAACSACSACYERVSAPVPPLSLPLPAAKPQAPRRAGWRARAVWAAGSVVSAALGAWLLLMPREAGLVERGSVKGGSMSMELVRVDAEGRQLAATHFAAGDRFKVSLSCAAEGAPEASVLVFQAGETFVAMPPHALGSCGNHRTLPGAFRLTGESAAEVCVVLSNASGAAELANMREKTALPEPHACVILQPETRPRETNR